MRLFDEGERREAYFSSMDFRPHGGRPFRADELVALFPPKEMTGLRYEHRSGELGGAALWMLGDDEEYPTPSWVLMAMMACPSASKIARCPVVCSEAADRPWALDVWRSIVRGEPPERGWRSAAGR